MARPGGQRVTPVDQLLAQHGIHLADTSDGEHSTTCPQCSQTRQKKTLRCLSVKIETNGTGTTVCWHCQHCSWSGPPKGAGANASNRASQGITYNYDDASGNLVFQKIKNPPGHNP